MRRRSSRPVTLPVASVAERMNRAPKVPAIARVSVIEAAAEKLSQAPHGGGFWPAPVATQTRRSCLCERSGG